MSFYTGCKVLCTGGTGLVGMPLVRKLAEQGANVTVAALDKPPDKLPGKLLLGDLTNWEFVKKAVRGQEMVFHLAGTKGGAGIGQAQKAQFFVPQLMFNTMVMEAARLEGVERFLYCSSIGVYGEVYCIDDNLITQPLRKPFLEGDTESILPSEANWYQGWAKLTGEQQAKVYRESYGWDKIAIARIANTYGPYDTFSGVSAMVVPSLIARAEEAHRMKQPLIVWGDGTPERDFIFSEDVADNLMLLLQYGADCQPTNIGSGIPTSIKSLVECITRYLPVEVQYASNKPNGAAYTVLDTTLMKQKLRWSSPTILEEGIRQTVEWYQQTTWSGKLSHHRTAFERSRLIE